MQEEGANPFGPLAAPIMKRIVTKTSPRPHFWGPSPQEDCKDFRTDHGDDSHPGYPLISHRTQEKIHREAQDPRVDYGSKEPMHGKPIPSGTSKIGNLDGNTEANLHGAGASAYL